MEKIRIDDKLYGYRIYPHFDEVKVEIYFIEVNIENIVLDKYFGRFWRKPIEKDYIEAQNWATNQLEYIKNANL